MLVRIVFAMLLLMSFQTFASIGTVSALKGVALILRGDQQLVIHLGDTIEEKDQIKTGEDTKVQVVFKDRTIVTIGKNTTFSVPQYVYGDAKTSKVEFNLSKGVFKSMTGKIGELAKQRFKIKTATATIGIRGTIYIVRVKGRQTDLSTLEGATYMQLKSNNKVYEVPAGKSLSYNSKTGIVNLTNLTTKTVMIQKDTDSQGQQLAENEGPESLTSSDNASGDSNTGNKVVSQAVSGTDGSTGDASNVNAGGSLAASNVSSVTNTVNNAVIQTNSGAAPTDLHQVTAGSDSYSTYGYWLDRNSGNLSTPFADKLNSTIPTYDPSGVLSTAKTAYYSGNLVAISGAQTATSSLLMQIHFNNNSVAGSMRDLSLNGHDWSNNFTGAVNTNGIAVNSFTPANASSDIKSISGSLNGKMYGNQGQGVAGTFSLTGTTSSATSTSVSGSYAAKGNGVK